MTALLLSPLSRHGSIKRTPKQLQHPPILPKRADPTSDDAKILGPFSKRREVNLKWRFFDQEMSRVQPPIEVFRAHVIEEHTPLHNPTGTSTTREENTERSKQPTLPLVGFQGTSVLRDLEAIASPTLNAPKRATDSTHRDPTSNPPTTFAVNRFIRRQHRKILAKIPILTYLKRPNDSTGKYKVSLSPLACSDKLTSAVPMADEADLAWLRLPPLPQELKVDRGPTPLQERQMKTKPVVETKSNSNQSPRADRTLKYKSNLVDGNEASNEVQHLEVGPGELDAKKPRVDVEPEPEEVERTKSEGAIGVPET